MSNTRSFSDFDSPDSGTTLSTTEAGVLLTDTLEDFREKTNGIVEKVKAIDAAYAVADTAIKAGGLNVNALDLDKIEQIAVNNLLGNVAGTGDGNVAEVQIDVAGSLQDSDDAIPTSKAVRDFQESRYLSARVNSDGTAVSLHGVSVAKASTGIFNIIVLDSHQLPVGESYSLVVSIGIDFSSYGVGTNRIQNSYQATIQKIDDVGGDPAYQLKLFELESYNAEVSNDANSISQVSLNYRDIPFSVIGLPATDV